MGKWVYLDIDPFYKSLTLRNSKTMEDKTHTDFHTLGL